MAKTGGGFGLVDAARADGADRRGRVLHHLAPRPRSRRIIALTPLVDIVFLLLTFFMLSSQLSPFGLLPLGGERRVGETEVPKTPAGGIGADLLISVDPGRVRLNGVAVPASALVETLRREKAAGAAAVTVVTSEGATVQDLVLALDAAKAAAFASIAIVDMR